MAGLQKDDFAQDRSQRVTPSKKAKNQGDALASSGRPSSGKRTSSHKDEMRSDLKRQKTVAANKQRKSIFGALTTSQMQQKKVNFGDGLDLSAEKDNQSVRSSDSEGEGDKGKGERLDLLGYNRRRKDKLREFDF